VSDTQDLHIKAAILFGSIHS